MQGLESATLSAPGFERSTWRQDFRNFTLRVDRQGATEYETTIRSNPIRPMTENQQKLAANRRGAIEYAPTSS